MHSASHASLLLATALVGFYLGRRSSPPRHDAFDDRRLQAAEPAGGAGGGRLVTNWQLSMRRLRGWRVTGPIAISCLKPEEQQLFGPVEPHAFDATRMEDSRSLMSRGQVPTAARKHMLYVPAGSRVPGRSEKHGVTGAWVRNWSAPLIDELVALAEADDPGVRPPDYPFAAQLHYKALAEHPVAGLDVMVAGSVSPWVEAILLSRRARSVTTVPPTERRTRRPQSPPCVQCTLRSVH